MAAILVSMLTTYYSKIFKFKHLALFFAIAFLAGGGITILREGVLITYGSASSTLAALDFVVSITPPTGLTHGFVQFPDITKIFSHTPLYGGRNLVSSLLGGRISISTTTTLYGPPFIDFGYIGLLFFIGFGFLLGSGYTAAKSEKGIYTALYSLVLVFLLLGIETGITDLIVWIYFFSASIFYLYAHDWDIVKISNLFINRKNKIKI